MSTLAVSVVIATFNRPEGVRRLLGDLAAQTLGHDQFEMIVVDDGSPVPLTLPEVTTSTANTARQALTVIRQDNAGPAAARNHGAQAARGDLLVFVDDDMRVGPDFLAAHLAAHKELAASSPFLVVLGALRAPADRRLPLVERYRLFQLARTTHNSQPTTHNPQPSSLHGGDVYSGNLSVPRSAFDSVGGFDVALHLSEDAEFGLRCESAGAAIVPCAAAWAVHDTNDPGWAGWVARSVRYGAADLAVASRHTATPAASPWRFLAAVNPVSRPLLLLSAWIPVAGRMLARLVLMLAAVCDMLRLEGIALRLVTLSYGLLYFSGLRAGLAAGDTLWSSMRRYLNAVDYRDVPVGGRCAKWLADLSADHDALAATDARYRAGTHRRSLIGDVVQRIGLQMMAAYRLMRLCQALHLGVVARALSRIMRHLYGADLHWDADFAPGVVIVHGMGLCISHGARVGPGCIIFQHVTLGESIHPVTRLVGAPTLEANVHVAPGAVLLGPIVVGAGSKVAANVVLTESVAPNSVVENEAPRIRLRERKSS